MATPLALMAQGFAAQVSDGLEPARVNLRLANHQIIFDVGKMHWRDKRHR